MSIFTRSSTAPCDLTCAISKSLSNLFQNTVDALDSSLTAFNDAIQTDGQTEIQTSIDNVYNQINGNITDYTDWITEQVRHKNPSRAVWRVIPWMQEKFKLCLTSNEPTIKINLIDLISVQIEDELGRCKPFYTSYTELIGVFCDYFMDTVVSRFFCKLV